MSLQLEFQDLRIDKPQLLGNVQPGSFATFEDVSEGKATFYILACLERARQGVYAQIHSSTDRTFAEAIPSGGLNDSNLLRAIGRFGTWRQLVTTTDGETGLLRATYVPDTYAISPWQPINDPVPDLP